MQPLNPFPEFIIQKRSRSCLKLEENQCKNIANQFYGKSKETNISKWYSILYYLNLCIFNTKQVITAKFPFNKIELVGKLKSNFFLPLTNKYVQCCPLKSLWMVVFNIYLEVGCASAFSQKFFWHEFCDDDSYHNMCFSIGFSTLINIVESRNF